MNVYGFAINSPINFTDYLGEYVKSFIVIQTAPGKYKIDIVFRVHWSSTKCDNEEDSKKLRKLEEQRMFDREASKIWSGSFSHKNGLFGLGEKLVTYDVVTKFESTYEDNNDPYPSEHFTAISQSPKYKSAENRANVLGLGGPEPSGILSALSIELFQGNSARVYAHEIGHKLGCQDRYKDVKILVKGKLQPISVPLPGWSHNIMANRDMDPDYRNIEEILSTWLFE